MMNRNLIATIGVLVLLVMAVSSSVQASSSFVADSNQFGYEGTVSNSTQVTGPWTFPTPRDGTLYYVHNAPAPYSGDYNSIQSNWYQHPLTNQNPGFFQINDGGTVTSANGYWTQNAGLWDFTLTVTGQNATYANSYSRLWQPDAGHAWGGTFTDYTYTITATGMTTYVANGWRWNNVAPAGITGSFDATFVSTQDVYGGPTDLTDGDTYVVSLDFDKATWDGTSWSNTYEGVDYGNYSTFGAPVPEPVTMLTGFLAVSGFGWYMRKHSRKRAGA